MGSRAVIARDPLYRLPVQAPLPRASPRLAVVPLLERPAILGLQMIPAPAVTVTRTPTSSLATAIKRFSTFLHLVARLIHSGRPIMTKAAGLLLAVEGASASTAISVVLKRQAPAYLLTRASSTRLVTALEQMKLSGTNR